MKILAQWYHFPLINPNRKHKQDTLIEPLLIARNDNQHRHYNQQTGGTMYYVAESNKAFEDAAADLEAAVRRNGFGVLHVHNLGSTLRSKGMDFDQQCKVFEVCKPEQAAKVLATDMRMNMALPCRISVYTQNGKTMIGMIKPTQIFSALSQDPALAQVAHEVEEKTMLMIDEAK